MVSFPLEQGSLPLADAAAGDQESVMSVPISKGGRLFGIMAGLGGAAMIGSAGLPWRNAVLITSDYMGYDISVPGGAHGRAVLVLGLLVIAGAACFTAFGSRRVRTTAIGLVVLAGATGLVIVLLADPRSLARRPGELPCTNPGFPPCIQGVTNDGGLWLAGWGAVLAAVYGIVALLRSGGESLPTPEAGHSPASPSGAAASEDFATPHERRMSDASVLAWTLVALVIALAVYFFYQFVDIVLSHDSL
jgi:hypothetical protein